MCLGVVVHGDPGHDNQQQEKGRKREKKEKHFCSCVRSARIADCASPLYSTSTPSNYQCSAPRRYHEEAAF